VDVAGFFLAMPRPFDLVVRMRLSYVLFGRLASSAS